MTSINHTLEQNINLERLKRLNINFEYFKNSYQNSVSGVDGKFKSMSGEDDRIRIFFDSGKDESIFDEIIKFKELLDSGAITKEEYDIEKERTFGL